MAHLIDKDAFVSEIERLTDKVCDRLFTEASVGAIILSKEILSFIDTLKVKEVDLEKEVNAYMVNEMKFLSDEIGYDTLLTIAKHFFELGLKAQKGE